MTDEPEDDRPQQGDHCELDADVLEEVECWRCHTHVSSKVHTCPWCSARLHTAARESFEAGSGLEALDAGARYFPRIMLAFGLLLIISIVNGLIQLFITDPGRRLLVDTLATVAVGIVTAVAWHRIRVAGPVGIPNHVIWVWVSAIPLLAASLMLNVAWHEGLRRFLGQPVAIVPFTEPLHIAWLLVLTTTFPAVCEEILFRHLILDGIQQQTGQRATAIWVSALMFGMAHIGQPLGIPYLFLFGVLLAMLRIGSGSLILPMLVHAVHNAAVVYLLLS